MALWVNGSAFDPKRGVKASTFAYQTINNAIRHAIRDANEQQQQVVELLGHELRENERLAVPERGEPDTPAPLAGLYGKRTGAMTKPSSPVDHLEHLVWEKTRRGSSLRLLLSDICEEEPELRELLETEVQAHYIEIDAKDFAAYLSFAVQPHPPRRRRQRRVLYQLAQAFNDGNTELGTTPRLRVREPHLYDDQLVDHEQIHDDVIDMLRSHKSPTYIKPAACSAGTRPQQQRADETYARSVITRRSGKLGLPIEHLTDTRQGQEGENVDLQAVIALDLSHRDVSDSIIGSVMGRTKQAIAQLRGKAEKVLDRRGDFPWEDLTGWPETRAAAEHARARWLAAQKDLADHADSLQLHPK